jgi:hypothetical protein
MITGPILSGEPRKSAAAHRELAVKLIPLLFLRPAVLNQDADFRCDVSRIEVVLNDAMLTTFYNAGLVAGQRYNATISQGVWLVWATDACA